MTCVHTRKSFAPSRQISSFAAVIVCFFVLFQSSGAFAHGTDFLFAKVIIGDGSVRLEITADCESNALIPNRSFAAAALPTAIQVQFGDYRKSLVELGDIRLEDRSQFDESVPLPPGTLDNSVSHQLLTALWHWKPSRDSIRFTVPKSSKLDVLLWISDTRKPDAEAKWMVLLGGDVSPPIDLKTKTSVPGMKLDAWMTANVTAVFVTVICGFVLFRRWQKRSARPAGTRSISPARTADLM